MPRLALAFALVCLFSAAAHADAAPPAATAQARVDAAAAVYEATLAQLQAGVATAEQVYQWSLRWCEAQREAGAPNAARDHLARMRSLETAVKARFQSGTMGRAEALAAAWYRVDAELAAARPKR